MADVHRYVDGVWRADANGTITKPWYILGSINWTAGTNNIKDDIDAGNNVIIHLKGGVTFAGTLNISYGGTSDAIRVTVDGNYATYPGGVGTNAIIDNWTTVAGAGFAGPDANGVYSIAWAVPAPTQVFEDFKTVAGLLMKQSAVTWVGDPGAWYWDANVLYYKPSAGAAGDHTIYRWNAYYSALTNHANGYMTISNLICKGAQTSAIKVSQDYVKVRNCTAIESYQGIIIDGADHCEIGGGDGYGNTVYNTWGSGGIYNINNSNYTLISYNEIYNCGNHNLNINDRNAIGVGGVAPGNNIIIEHNYIHDNGPTNYSGAFDRAIELYSTEESIVRYNFLLNNYGGGIGVTTNSNNCKIYGNIASGNGRNSDVTTTTNVGDYFLASSTGLEFYNNVGYGNVNNNNLPASASLALSTAGAFDCIVKNNILSSPVNQTLVYVGAGTTLTGPSINNNCYDKAGDQFIYDGVANSFADWKLDIGADINGIQTSPDFVNAGGSYDLDSDFKIGYGSPCFATGASVNYAPDYDGIYGPPSIGAYTVATGGGLTPDLSLSGGRMIPPRRRRR